MSQPNDAYGRRPQPDRPTEQYSRDQYADAPGPGRPQSRFGGQPNPFGTEGNDQFGIVGMVLGLLGGVVLLVSFLGLDWFDNGAGFGDVHDMLDAAGDSANGFASAYFSWFAWTFFIIALIAALGSSFPSPALRIVRVVGVVAGMSAAGLSFLAIRLVDGTDYTEFLKSARAGFYAGVIGFVLVGIGAAIGPRKV